MKKQIQLSDHFTYGRLFNFTLPSIGMMVFASVYSVVDGFFVSNFAGKTPFAAINLITPFLMILYTVGFMFGTGGSAIVSKAFGKGEKEKANQYFSLFVYIAFTLSIAFAILGFVFIRPIAVLLGAEGEILKNAIVYARIILIALPFNVTQFLFQSFFVTAEKPKLGLLSTVISGCTNIILDAVLVILLPQELKLAGASLATALSQIVGGVIPLVYFSRKNSSILCLGKTKFDAKAILQACTNGSSEFMSNVSMSIVGMLYNIQLMKYAGENGIASYGVMMYISSIFAAAFLGYVIGIAPIIGYNDGSKNYLELKGLFKKSLIIVGTLGIIMVVIAELFATSFAKIFVGYDAELMSLTVYGFRIFALSFCFMGFAIFASGFFTALNDGITSAIISFLRTLVFQVAAILILPIFLHIDGVWISIVIAEFMAFIVGTVFLVAKRKKYHYI